MYVFHVLNVCISRQVYRRLTCSDLKLKIKAPVTSLPGARRKSMNSGKFINSGT